VGFEHTIQASEREKIVHALDRAATRSSLLAIRKDSYKFQSRFYGNYFLICSTIIMLSISKRRPQKGRAPSFRLVLYELVPKNVSLLQVADAIVRGIPVGGLTISGGPPR
jgi:hypothetical protein